MELDIVDQLLICLADQPRNVPMTVRAFGYTHLQISEAWAAARAADLQSRQGEARIGLLQPGERGQ